MRLGKLTNAQAVRATEDAKVIQAQHAELFSELDKDASSELSPVHSALLRTEWSYTPSASPLSPLK